LPLAFFYRSWEPRIPILRRLPLSPCRKPKSARSQTVYCKELGKRIPSRGGCGILVANFALPSGAASQLGMQLADAFSNGLASQKNAIQVIERSRLQTYLEQERVPMTLLHNEKAIRWLGKQLGATVVLTGTTAKDQGASVRVQVSLLSCDKEKAGPIEEFSFPDSDSRTGLNPIGSFPETLSSPNPSSIPLVLRAGVGGVTSPGCSYCPQPNYTNPAREAKFMAPCFCR